MTETRDTPGAREKAHVEQRVARRVMVIWAIFFPMVAAINASSIVAEARRAGEDIDARLPWLLEFTSLAAIAPPILMLIAARRHRLLVSENLPLSAISLLLASFAFTLVHVAGMALLRGILAPFITGETYVLLADPVRDFLYEYRKDLFPFAVIVGLLVSSRQLEESRLEADAARSEARRSGRLTLRCGGRTIFLDAGGFEWARTAGNYVELHSTGQAYLVRITLTALETLLRDAGVDATRIHRSLVVNRAMVRATTPTGDGDFNVQLADGSELRGSRRYRRDLTA